MSHLVRAWDICNAAPSLVSGQLLIHWLPGTRNSCQFRMLATVHLLVAPPGSLSLNLLQGRCFTPGSGVTLVEAFLSPVHTSLLLPLLMSDVVVRTMSVAQGLHVVWEFPVLYMTAHGLAAGIRSTRRCSHCQTLTAGCDTVFTFVEHHHEQGYNLKLFPGSSL